MERRRTYVDSFFTLPAFSLGFLSTPHMAARKKSPNRASPANLAVEGELWLTTGKLGDNLEVRKEHSSKVIS